MSGTFNAIHQSTRVCVTTAVLKPSHRQNNVSPRLGCVVSVFVAEDTVRGSFGLSRSRSLAARPTPVSSHNSTNLDTIQTEHQPGVWSDRSAGLPTSPRRPRTSSSVYHDEIRICRTHIRTGELRCSSRSATGSSAVNYQHVRGAHLIISLNQNVPNCTAQTDPSICAVRTDFQNNSQYSPARIRNMTAYLSFQQRPMNGQCPCLLHVLQSPG